MINLATMLTQLYFIRKVGIKDWWWFVIYLKGDEFSNKLDQINYLKKQEIDFPSLLNDRVRAHRLDMEYTNVKSI